ncbi:MAG: adenosylcobinamide-GDP ribazoletransferase [Hydrogenoanaerobacterium sp.]
MSVLKSFIVAFSMYSQIPMPKVLWDKKSMEYSMCFFPLIGVVCGAVMFLWLKLAGAFCIGFFLNAVCCTLLPLLITGGIHLDGFCDTTDALASHAGSEKRLEILSDPHIGAFGVMGCASLLLLTVALWSELIINTSADERLVTVLCIGFVLSRSLSGLSVVGFKAAKKTGTLAQFADSAQNTQVRVVLIIFSVICFMSMMLVSPVAGFAAALAAVIVFFIYRYASYKNFGGITGDLAGWFLTLCELAILAAVTLTGRFLN